MIATILADTAFYKESINTLKYASIAKTIRNKPHINENDSDELVVGLREEITVLRKKLADAELMNSPTSTIKQLRDELEYREQRIKDRDKSWQARIDESKEAFNNMVKKLEEEKTCTRQLLEQIETLQRGSEMQRSIVADTQKATIEYYEEKLNNARTSDMTQESEKRIIDLQNRILTLSTKDFELTECRAKYDDLMTRYYGELNQKESEYKKIIADMEKENEQLRKRIAQLSEEKCGFLKRLQLVERK
jgi:kinesin family protein 3/17